MAAAPTAAPARRGPHLATALTVLLVAVLSLWHAAEASQHLLTDRDPGVYVTAGRWLAREGTLLVDPAVGPFADHPGLGFEEQGWNLDADGRLEPQFLHLLPVGLAAAHVVGGDRLLLVAPAAVAGAALLALAAFARRALRPWWAFAATAALAASLPWVHLSRDAFSEPLAALLLFAGLAVLHDADRLASPRRAAVAGLLLGAVAMARVEGFVLLLPLVAVAALAEGAARRAGTAGAGRRAVVRGAAAGLAVTITFAVADLALFGSWYLGDLRGLLSTVAVGLVVVAVGGSALVAAAPGLPTPSASWRAAAGQAVAGTAVLVVLAAWVVRPLVSTVTGAPSAAIAALEAGGTGAGVRRYSEHSVQWLAWYAGPVVVALGFATFARACGRAVAGRSRDAGLVPFLAVFATLSALYLWRPSIVPDHVWVMRRYALVTLPGLAVLGALGAQLVVDRVRSARGALPAALLAGAAAVALVGVPASTLVPVARATTQEGLLGKVSDVCEAVGDDGAAVVVPGGAAELVLAQALRSFCGIPVAIARPGFGAGDVAALAAAWAADGRALHLVGADPAALAALGAVVELAVAIPNDELVEETLTGRPDELIARPVTLAVAPAPVG